MPRLLAIASLALAIGVLPAQAPYAVGVRTEAWTSMAGVGPFGSGSPVLDVTVRYPAAAAGTNGPILPHANGWPVVVFLHGFGELGANYTALGDAWASAGFVVVALDTALVEPLTQADDAIALHSAIVLANTQPGGFFAGRLDTQRQAIAGHSMGGGIAGVVLAYNPGYRCGLALAPLDPGPMVAAAIHVPFGVVVGAGDTGMPWQTYSQPFYDGVASQDGLKFLYLLDNDCDHANVAGLSMLPTPDVFARVAELGVGFLRHFLDVSITGLEKVVGVEAHADPRLVLLAQEVAEPQIWVASPLRLGRQSRVSVASERGFGGVVAALAPGPGVSTSIGTLLVDPNTAVVMSVGQTILEGRIDAYLSVPKVPALVGLTVALQGVGVTPTAPLLLGSAIVLQIEP